MSMFDGIKKVLMGDTDEDDELLDEEEEMGYEAPPAEPSAGNYSEPAAPRRPRAAAPLMQSKGLQMKMFKPRAFEDVLPIADEVNKKNIVLLNLEETDQDLSRRLIDFLSGVAYANQSVLKMAAINNFAIAPADVPIEGDSLGGMDGGNDGVWNQH